MQSSNSKAKHDNSSIVSSSFVEMKKQNINIITIHRLSRCNLTSTPFIIYYVLFFHVNTKDQHFEGPALDSKRDWGLIKDQYNWNIFTFCCNKKVFAINFVFAGSSVKKRLAIKWIFECSLNLCYDCIHSFDLKFG